MKQLFQPAVALMNRLKYPQKFLLISILFAVPLAFTTTLFISEIDSRIALAQKELYGSSYLRSLRSLLEHMLQEQFLAHEVLNGDIARTDELLAIQSKIDTDLSALAAVDQQYGQLLQTSGQLTMIRSDWDSLKPRVLRIRTRTSDDLHGALISNIRALIYRVGDNSNLILDPDLDSYYLVDTVLLKLPEMHDLLAQTHLLSTRVIGQQSVSAEDRAQLIILTGLVQSNVNATQRALAIANNNNLAGNVVLLQPAQQAYVVNTSQLLATLRTEVINKRQITLDPLAYHDLVDQTLNSSFVFWDYAVETLDALVQARIDGFSQTKLLAMSVTTLVLLLVSYLWVAFYLAVMRTVSGLDGAAKRMIGGSVLEPVQISNRDELGQVVRSFNAIATALVAASAQRQAVVDNAVDGIITVDERGIINSFNPAAERIFGYSTSEALGQPVQLLLPEPHHQQYQIVGVGREVLGRRKDGTLFPLDLAVGEMHLDEQRMFIGMAHDLTERKRAEAERARLQEQIIRAQAATLAELSTPLIPISDQVMVMPLIGAVDEQRAQQVMEALLRGVEQSRARVAILDITGVPVVDTQVANALIQAARAVKLLGAQVVLTGIHPDVAQTLVSLGLSLSDIVTHSTLQSGVAYATGRS